MVRKPDENVESYASRLVRTEAIENYNKFRERVEFLKNSLCLSRFNWLPLVLNHERKHGNQTKQERINALIIHVCRYADAEFPCQAFAGNCNFSFLPLLFRSGIAGVDDSNELAMQESC